MWVIGEGCGFFQLIVCLKVCILLVGVVFWAWKFIVQALKITNIELRASKIRPEIPESRKSKPSLILENLSQTSQVMSQKTSGFDSSLSLMCIIDWCCFYYFVRNSLVALLEALCEGRVGWLERTWIFVGILFTKCLIGFFCLQTNQLLE